MEKTLNERFAEFAEFIIKLKTVGNNADEFIVKYFPNLEGRDFSKPETFTDEEINAIFEWLQELD